MYLLARSVADPFSDNDLIVSKLLRENNLVERFGDATACSNIEKPKVWEQAILLVDRRSVLQQKAYAFWLEVTNEAAALCQSMGFRNFNCGHDQIIEFVLAIDDELLSQNKTEFADLFKETKGFSFGAAKGLVTSIEDIPKKSARYCRVIKAFLGIDSRCLSVSFLFIDYLQSPRSKPWLAICFSLCYATWKIESC